MQENEYLSGIFTYKLSSNNKLKRSTVSFEKMMAIAEASDVGYEQAFVLPDGEEI